MDTTLRNCLLASTMAALAACASNPVSVEKTAMADDAFGTIRATTHRDGDDLLSAGLGLAGLRGPQPTFAQSEQPTPAELRRRAIHSNWRGIADLGPLGGYGEIYGAVPLVTGREYSAFATLAGARAPHRVLVQVPDLFDRERRCVVVTASSGSRGIYGAIALAGAWGLPRGCAVAYTDKGAGTGYFDVASGTGVRLDGSRGEAGGEPLEFAPPPGIPVAPSQAVLVKHAHSGDNPEAEWGRHVRQAARFALHALDEAFPGEAPFTAANTRILATGLSNGGGAVLRAAEIDDGLLDGVVAIEPNIWAGQGGRPLFDYVSEAGLLLPCALVDSAFDAVPFARVNGGVPPAWRSRCQALHEDGRLSGADEAARAGEALERLRGTGWSEAAIASAAASTALDLWRSIGATYAAAYLRSGVGDMPCGYGFAAFDAGGRAHAPTATERAAWWADASGIPPGAAVGLVDAQASGADAALPGLLCLGELWTRHDAAGERLHAGVAMTRASLPRADLPIAIVHGVADGLVPIMFSSDPYVAWLEANGRKPMYWRVGHAQHFDAFLAFPGFGDRYVPMLPYAYAALDHLWAHLAGGTPLPASADIATTPRGSEVLGAHQLGRIPGD